MIQISRKERDYIISKEPNVCVAICSKDKRKSGKTYYVEEILAVERLLNEYANKLAKEHNCMSKKQINECLKECF